MFQPSSSRITWVAYVLQLCLTECFYLGGCTGLNSFDRAGCWVRGFLDYQFSAAHEIHGSVQKWIRKYCMKDLHNQALKTGIAMYSKLCTIPVRYIPLQLYTAHCLQVTTPFVSFIECTVLKYDVMLLTSQLFWQFYDLLTVPSTRAPAKYKELLLVIGCFID